MGDWNVILDPNLDRGGRGASGSDRCESSLIDLLAKHDLVDRFHLDHLLIRPLTRFDLTWT